MRDSWRLGPQPALQGVRAIAVMAAFAYHVGYMPGGWLGVEAFFVLSGFIITCMVLWEARNGRFKARSFYARRIARLLPASTLVVAAVVVFSVTMHLSVGTHLLGALSSLTYWANVPPALGHGLVMLGHIWSLSIEEQFYIVWPLLAVALLRRRGLRAVALAAALGLSVSVVLRFVFAESGFDRVYYGSDTRAAGLFIGCLAAALATGLGPGLFRRITPAATVVAGISLSVALLVMPVYNVWTWRVGVTAFDVLVAVAIVGLVDARHWLARLLALRPMVYLGDISYGIYLWHVPVITGAGLTMDPGLARLAIQLIVPFLLAAASYRYVEEPIRTWVRGRVPGGHPRDHAGRLPLHR